MSRRNIYLSINTSASTRAQLMAELESEDRLLTEAGEDLEQRKADLAEHIERARKLRAALAALGAEMPEPPAS